jgi:uncharacterized membrane protein YfcA
MACCERRRSTPLPHFLVWPGLVLLGVGVGAYGTMIGAGGGFVLVPLLLILYPDDSPELITSISLAVVFFNALSGTVAYVRQRRVDYLAANLFALATMPGAIAGALVVGYIPRDLFDVIFAFALIGVSALISLRPAPSTPERAPRRAPMTRILTDAHGDSYIYSYDLRLGILLSLAVGFVSSLLGIGGGVIHVPIMVLLLHFPAHIATATSHYVLAVTALTGTLVHLASGEFDTGFDRMAALAVGVTVGAQLGARLSRYVRSAMLIRLLGLALGLVGLRLLLGVVA